MGTNYYIKMNTCQHCNHTPERIHIGKSSKGWAFALHVDENFKCLQDYIDYVEENNLLITSEYEDQISVDELKDICLNRSCDCTIEKSLKFHNEIFKSNLSMEQWLYNNSAVEGPRNLLRSKIDNIHCIGHDGDIDLISGIFS